MGGGHGMPTGDRPSRGTGRATSADMTAKRPKPPLKKVLPEVWELMRPRKWLIAGSFCLMVVNRVAGLVMPFVSKPLMDKVLSTSGNPALLPRMIALVFGAMLTQAITSYAGRRLGAGR